MIRRFLADRNGNFAVLSALMMLPFILAVGFAIDGSRYYKARAHLQDAVDTAALAVAATSEQDTEKLRLQAEDFILSNLASNTIEGVQIASFQSDEDEINVGSNGFIRTTFMRLANVETMPVAASTLARRAPEQVVEVALVLDNTYSMIEKDPKTGESRIDTLRKAARNLVETLLPEDKDNGISIALVPYADHVNVGVSNKNATWLQLRGEERTESQPDTRSCGPRYADGTHQVCKAYSKKTCVQYVDGVREEKQCNDQCVRWETETRYRQDCTGETGYNRVYAFHGCVGTRTSNLLRLDDTAPTSRYPGYVEQTQRCARPILPLSKNRSQLIAAVSGMSHKPSNYNAYTHIPSGLVWGLNVLSPTEPFSEGLAYDATNVSPRKTLILMTDGDNTLIHNSNGKHVEFNQTSQSTKDRDYNSVNGDTASVCENIKATGIEVYTIAFMVSRQDVKSLLRDCATDDAHYFDATDAAKLTATFSGIARSISQVRLAR